MAVGQSKKSESPHRGRTHDLQNTRRFFMSSFSFFSCSDWFLIPRQTAWDRENSYTLEPFGRYVFFVQWLICHINSSIDTMLITDMERAMESLGRGVTYSGIAPLLLRGYSLLLLTLLWKLRFKPAVWNFGHRTLMKWTLIFMAKYHSYLFSFLYFICVWVVYSVK